MNFIVFYQIMKGKYAHHHTQPSDCVDLFYNVNMCIMLLLIYLHEWLMINKNNFGCFSFIISKHDKCKYLLKK